MFKDQTERSTRRESKKSQRAERAGSRHTASDTWGWNVGFVLSTMGSHGEDFKHWGDMN